MKDEIMILPCKDEEQHILNEKPFSRKDAKVQRKEGLLTFMWVVKLSMCLFMLFMLVPASPFLRAQER